MRGQFDIEGHGRYYIGTYALRQLTKKFSCGVHELITIATNTKTTLDFTVYLLMYAKDNHIIQTEEPGKLIETTEREAELILDELGENIQLTENILDALCMSILGKGLKEAMEDSKNATPAEQEEEKKIGSPTGKKSIK